MIRRAWRRWRALQIMARHERWRVAMGCPGAVRSHVALDDDLTPIRGEVYCHCDRCDAARRIVGWDP